MTQLFRELLAMTDHEKELTITANMMLQGLHRHGLHDFCSPLSQLIDQTTFTEKACDEIEKMKTKIYKSQATSLTPTTKHQSSPSRGMTHNDALKRTPHPERGGGSNASPGVEGERAGVGYENTHRRVPFRGWKGEPNVSPSG